MYVRMYTHTVTCPLLAAPENGLIDCDLKDGPKSTFFGVVDGIFTQPELILLESIPEANPGNTCNFNCKKWFVLSGSNRRTCEVDGSWSGTNTTCTRPNGTVDNF